MQLLEQDHLSKPFGGPGRYYAREDMPPERRQGREAIHNLLSGFRLDLKEQVKSVCREWNTTVRDSLRREMGLSLSMQNTRKAVPYRVIDGLPAPLEQALVNEPLIGLWPLPLYRSTLEQTGQGISLLAENLPAIERFGLSSTGMEELSSVQMTVQALLELLAETDMAQTILNIEEDVLGSYFYLIPVVHVYWMAISLVSSLLRIPVSDLTLVTLTHELAHAYTHLGLDIDGGYWDTDAFSMADISIVEGLAQFYTRQVGVRLGSRVPGMGKAFESLLKQQPQPYTEFQSWGEPTDPHLGEVVRFSLLACRLQRTTQYGQILAILDEARGQLGKRKHP